MSENEVKTISAETLKAAAGTGAGNDDPWKHRSKGMVCGTCMWHVNCRCRRHAPTMSGYPAVFSDTDWCGDHKMDKTAMGGQ